MFSKKKALPLLITALALSGCSSMGKGIAEAIMEKQKQEDTRMCQVEGDKFSGIETSLNRQDGQLKVLMVHGVGDHAPGYSTEFLEKLAKEMGLTAKSRHNKNISLTLVENEDERLGNLRITRLQDAEKTKEMLFYELTWSEITEPEKALLKFDTSGDYSFRRTEINGMMKAFANDTGPDPIIYLGKSREIILRSFAQSFCWMVKGEWDKLPDEGNHACSGFSSNIKNILHDDYVVVSHSLGSRISIDGMQFIADLLANPEKRPAKAAKEKHLNEAVKALQSKHIPLFMLSNQLPMLQLGRELPEVTGQYADYCLPSGKNYAKRMASKTSIIAFSDPNDLLSYAIPPRFEEKYLDSRLCTDVTNVTINIAYITDLFGIGKVANPLDAHVGYDTDERVVALIAKGIGHHHTAPIINERCSWVELTD